MSDAQLDIVLSAKDMSQQAFNSLNKNIEGVGGGLEMFKNKLGQLAAGYGVFKTISQALESAKLGSTLEKQAQAFSNLSEASGVSSKKMLDGLKASSQGLIAEADLMGAAGKALLMNIPAEKISELMKIAAATSKATGQSMTEAFNDITMGVARQSKMILDNLGIIVDVDKANKDYARTLGTTAEALTDAQKRQAFMNAVLEAGNDMIKRLGTSSGELTGVNKLIAAQTNLWNEVSKTVASFLDKELSGYAKMINWIDEKLKGMRASAGESSMADARKEIEMLRSLESKGMAAPGSTMNKQSEFNRRWGGTSEAEIAAQRSHQEWQKPDWMASWRAREGVFAENTEEQNKQLIKDREEWLKKVADEAKKAEEAVKKLHEEVKKLEDEFADSKVFSGEGSNYERMQAQLRTGYQLSDMETRRIETESDAWAKEALSWNKNLMDKVAEYEKTHKSIVDLSQATAEAMQSNFSNLFFDAMTGKLKTLEDYTKAVFDSLARMVSDLASQQLTRSLFGPEMKGGGWLSSLFRMMGVGGGSAANLPINTPGAFASAQPFHEGGTVDGSGPFRQVPSWMFSAAPRLHNGLAPDEFPAVLQRGERVIKKGGSSGDTHVHNHYHSANGRIDRESVSAAQAGTFAALARSARRNN